MDEEDEQTTRERERKRSTGEEFARRLSHYGGVTLCIAEILLNGTRTQRHVGDQLMRCATAPGAHYEEARGAQSTKDFIYKVSLALKEAEESLHWLRVAVAAEWGLEGIDELVDEGSQLVRMLRSSKETAQRNRGRRR